jgi:micrococcal nuclease
MNTLRRLIACSCMVTLGTAGQATFASESARGTGEGSHGFSGTVIRVSDGDSLVIRDMNGANYIVRLTDIDAPETAHGQGRPGQPFSAKATAHLKDLALGVAADVACYGTDVRQHRDGPTRVRHICRVYVGGRDLSLLMVEAGLAMANRQNRRYVRDQAVYSHEDLAKRQKAGLWSLQDPIPPWVWRRMCWRHGFCEAVERIR